MCWGRGLSHIWDGLACVLERLLEGIPLLLLLFGEVGVVHWAARTLLAFATAEGVAWEFAVGISGSRCPGPWPIPRRSATAFAFLSTFAFLARGLRSSFTPLFATTLLSFGVRRGAGAALLLALRPRLPPPLPPPFGFREGGRVVRAFGSSFPFWAGVCDRD